MSFKVGEKILVKYSLQLGKNKRKISFDGIITKVKSNFIEVLNRTMGINIKFFLESNVEFIKCQ